MRPHNILIFLTIFPLAVIANQDLPNESENLLTQNNNIELEEIKDSHSSDVKTVNQEPKEGCQFKDKRKGWIDGVRSKTHNRLCRSVRWVDGLFGDEHDFNDQDFRSKVSIGFRLDEADGLDPRVRIRIKTKLPNVSDRFNAFVGRVEEDSYISNTEVNLNRLNAVGLRSDDGDEAEWLVGIGYRNPNARSNGFDYSIGAKLSHGLNPYAKIAHRYLFTPNDASYWRTTQTVFWRRDEGYGYSSNLDYTRLFTDRDILEWDTRVKYTEDSSQWEWITGTSWHHSFTKKKGISSRIYVRGEEENEVAIPEYGLTFTYVRPFFRPWIFLETGVDFRWEKEYDGDSYESVVRFGFQFEMLIGDYYLEEKKHGMKH